MAENKEFFTEKRHRAEISVEEFVIMRSCVEKTSNTVEEIEKLLFKGNGKKPLLTLIDSMETKIDQFATDLKTVRAWQMGIMAAVVIAIIIELFK